jgi:hypothetical protein
MPLSLLDVKIACCPSNYQVARNNCIGINGIVAFVLQISSISLLPYLYKFGGHIISTKSFLKLLTYEI